MPDFMQQQAPQSEMQADICPQCGTPVLPGAAVCLILMVTVSLATYSKNPSRMA